MPANVDGMVREGVSAYRAGRKDEARALLMRAVEIDQYNEQAWLWLSAVVESVEEQRTCLENVLTINPANERAKQGIDMLTQKASGAAKATAPAPADDVLFNTSFTPPPAPPTANPFNAEADEELPSSIEWDSSPTATSSVSSNQRVKEPSQAEYDDWVSNLNLGGASATKSALPSDTEKLLSMPADDDEEEDIFDLQASLSIQADDSDDLFSSGPFDESAASMPDPMVSATPSRSSAASSPRSAPTKNSPKDPDALLDELEDEPADDSAFLDEFDDEEMEKVEASEFFRYIPREIKATRLPGTRERYPALVIVGVLVTLLLNAAAVAFLVMHLTSG